MKQAPAARIKARDRCGAALSVLSGGRVAGRGSIDGPAATLMASYASDLSLRVLEDAAVLAKHRGAKEIDVVDVNLVLIKKYGILMPPIDGVPRVTLHKETLPVSYAPLQYMSAAAQQAAALAAMEDDDDGEDDGEEGGGEGGGGGGGKVATPGGAGSGKQKDSAAKAAAADPKGQPKRKRTKKE